MSTTIGTLPPGSPSPVVIPINRPAANNEWTITVPNNTRWEILNIYAELDLDSNVAARWMAVKVTDGTDTIFLSTPGTSNSSSSNQICNTGTGLKTSNPVPGTLAGAAGLPNRFTVRAGYVIASLTANMESGDRYDNLAMLVMEWIDVGT